jgi:hypothetical protein
MTHPRLPERRQPTDPSSPRRLSRPLRVAQTDPPRTLTEVHEELVRIRPARQAPLEQWLAHHQRSADLYAEVAEIDRAHHHEALYMAEHERERAKEIEAQLATRRPAGSEQREGVGCGENRDGRSAEDLDAGS